MLPLPENGVDAGAAAASPWVEISGTLATNDTIAAYDGQVRLSDEALYSLAETLNGGAIPFNVGHDSAKNVRAREVHVWVEAQKGGRLVVRFTAQVDKHEWSAADGMLHMSFSTFESIQDDGPQNDEGNIRVAADAAWFFDQDILDAATAVQAFESAAARTTATGARIYQFQIVPDPRIILDTSLFLWQFLGANLVASALWDGAKYLLTRRRVRPDRDSDLATTIEVHLSSPHGDTLKAIVRTRSEQVAAGAFQRLPDLVERFMADSRDPRTIRVWTNTDGTSVSEWDWRSP